jgi:hypothetical protein
MNLPPATRAAARRGSGRRARSARWLIVAVAAGTLRLRAAEIHEAVRSNDAARVESLLEQSAAEAVNAVIGEGITALHLAAALNEEAIAGLLILRGADVNARTLGGFTPLHWAASRDAVDTAKLLLGAGADIHARTSKGITPLHWAAGKNAVNVVTLLLGRGADAAETTELGMTPLHWAVMNGAAEAAMLLSYKIVDNEMDEESLTPKPPPPSARDVLLDSLAESPLPKAPAAPSAGETKPVLPEPPKPPVELGKVLRVNVGFQQTLEFVWVEMLDLWAGRYEITNGQYRRFKPTHDSGAREGISLNGDDQPVVLISWNEAREFVDWLNRTFAGSLPAGCRFRLPLELEWMLLAKCGDNRRYPWGNQWPPAYGNFSDLSARRRLTDWQGIRGYEDGYPVTCPVAQSGANEWGLCGLAGNVWEWCEDWYDVSRKYKVRRGGGWDFDQEPNLRIETRGFDRPDARYDTIGLRLVVSRS